MTRHRQAGGLCYEIADDQLMETEGGERRAVMTVAELPGAFDGQARHVLANALAAVAACRAAGVSTKDIRHGLMTFTPEEANPGRGNIYRAGGSPVIVDYGHNAAALDATGRFVSAVWGGSPVAAVTLPGDRRDDLLARTAEAIAARFGTVVLYEDSDKRGRKPGEMIALIRAALSRARPGIGCEEAENPAEALRKALAMASGAPVLFLYEKLALAHDALIAVGAQPWPEASRPVLTDSVVAEAESMTADLASAITAAATTVAATTVAATTGVATTRPAESIDVVAATALAPAPAPAAVSPATVEGGMPGWPAADASADYCQAFPAQQRRDRGACAEDQPTCGCEPFTA